MILNIIREALPNLYFIYSMIWVYLIITAIIARNSRGGGGYS